MFHKEMWLVYTLRDVPRFVKSLPDRLPETLRWKGAGSLPSSKALDAAEGAREVRTEVTGNTSHTEVQPRLT